MTRERKEWMSIGEEQRIDLEIQYDSAINRMRYDLEHYIHTDINRNRIDVRNIEKRYQKNLYKWYTKRLNCYMGLDVKNSKLYKYLEEVAKWRKDIDGIFIKCTHHYKFY